MKRPFYIWVLLPVALILIVWVWGATSNQRARVGILNHKSLAANFPSTPDPSPTLQPFRPDGVIQLTKIADNLEEPIGLENAGDDRLFVIERKGRIRIIDVNGNVAFEPFLDISSSLYSTHQDSGLLGLAFHPDYATNGYFYVYYTYDADPGFDVALRSRLARFSRSENNPQIADPASEAVLLEIAQPFHNHNGGAMEFSAEGYLYLATGDGGLGGDRYNNGQNGERLLGKILRIDVDSRPGSLPADCGLAQNFTIPKDNPWADGPGGICDAIWLTGLRSPWRMSIDKTTQDLWISDVGQKQWEEIDHIPAGTGGLNMGWRCYEGLHAYNLDGCGPRNNYEMPVYEYEHGQEHCAVIGGEVYRGKLYPQLQGEYFFSDYCSGFIRSYNVTTSRVSEWEHKGDGSSPVAYGQDVKGELYIVYITGQVYQLGNPVWDETQP